MLPGKLTRWEKLRSVDYRGNGPLDLRIYGVLSYNLAGMEKAGPGWKIDDLKRAVNCEQSNNRRPRPINTHVRSGTPNV